MKHVSRKAPLTEAEEINVARQARNGDLEARNTLVMHNQRFLIKEVKDYCSRHPGLDLEDMISEANIGLIKAAERFDPDRGCRFITYAKYWILQALNNYALQNTGIVRLPVKKAEQLVKIRSAMEPGANANAEELALRTGLEVSTVNEILPFAARDSSLDEVFTTSSGKDGEPLVDWVCQVNVDFEENLMNEELRNALDNLPERQRDILLLRSGAFGSEQLALSEIATRYSVSKERIRQIEIQALNKCHRLIDSISA